MPSNASDGIWNMTCTIYILWTIWLNINFIFVLIIEDIDTDDIECIYWKINKFISS